MSSTLRTSELCAYKLDKLNLKIGANEHSLTTTTLAALENRSKVVRAYLAYYGILGLMGLVGLITSCCKLLGAASKFAPLK